MQFFSRVCPMAFGLVLAFSPIKAWAASYAGEVTTNGDAGSFYLNESASSYTISFSDGPSITVDNPAAGLQDFRRPSANDTFSISVTTNDAPGWTSGTALQIGQDSSLTTFNFPAGVAVNQNPGADFGRIYIDNLQAPTTNPIISSSGVTRSSDGQGIYALNSDQSDAFGYGNTAMTAGIPQLLSPLSNVDGGAPFRLTVGPDNNLYVGDSSSSAGNIYRINDNLTSGYNLLYAFPGVGPSSGGRGGQVSLTADAITDNHGNFFSKPIVTIDGSGNVFIYAIDNLLSTGPTDTYQAIRKYSIGTETSAPTAPLPETLIADPLTVSDTTSAGQTLNTFSGGLNTDLAIGPSDGRFYYMEHRGNEFVPGPYYDGNVAPGLFVIDPKTGNTIFDSLQETLALNPSATWDKIADVNGMAISPDNKYLAFIVTSTIMQYYSPTEPPVGPVCLANQIDIVPLDANIDGISGLPDLAKMMVITNAFPSPSSSNEVDYDIAFDAADNIYVADPDLEMIRAFSPGGTSVDVTSYNGSTYAFSRLSESSGLSGDANGDGKVDATDLAIIQANLGFKVAGGYVDGDLNGDGVVNADDFALYTLGLSEYQASLTSVPEPGAASILVIAATFSFRRRRVQ